MQKTALVGLVGMAVLLTGAPHSLGAEQFSEENSVMQEKNWQITGPRTLVFEGESFTVPPIDAVQVTDEAYPGLPVHQSAGGWNDGLVLKGLEATGCSLADALQPDSVLVKTLDGTVLERGKDYQFTDQWATLGRVEGGRIAAETPVTISYVYTPMRLDSIVRTADGDLRLLIGATASFCPQPPPLPPGAQRLLNIYGDATAPALTAANLFPILETAAPAVSAAAQQACIPNTMAKLRNGEKVRILAWGDSVTECVYLPEADRWQAQFVKRLQARYPQAQIELLSNGWGGRTVSAFLGEPSGSPYNFAETVLAVKPDLVVSEFVNDAGLPPDEWRKSFPFVLEEFRRNHFEWIILTPHYVRPDWMGLTSQNGPEIEADPRPYVQFLREFAAENQVGLADAARLYGRLWRQGIPYNTLMTNNINHPDQAGMKLFADALMAIFE